MDSDQMRLEVPRPLCIALVGLGVAAYTVTAAIDVYYGQSTTVSEHGRLLQGASMFLVPGFTFAFTCLAGFLFNGGRWIAALAIVGLIGAYMAYSASNGIGFVATETIGKRKMFETQAKQAGDTVSLQNAQALKAQDETLDWLKRTYTQERRGDDKERVLSKLTEIAAAPVVLKQVSPQDALADAKAMVFSKWLGVDVESVQMGNAAWLVALLIMGKLLGPTLGFGFWPRKSPEEIWKDRVISRKSKETPTRFTKVEAMQDISAMAIANVVVGSNLEMARRWGVAPGTASKWLRAAKEEGLISRQRNGFRKTITPTRPNGNGHAAIGNA